MQYSIIVSGQHVGSLMICLLLLFIAKWNHLYVAAKKYAEDHNGENYFSTLTKVSELKTLRVILLSIIYSIV